MFQPRDPRTGDWAAFRESAEGVRLLALMDAFGRKVEVRERDFHRLWWRYLKSGSDVEADAERGHATVVDLPPGVTAHSMDMETLATTKMATTQATSTSQHHVLIIFGGNAGEAMLNIHSADSALQRHRRIYVEYPGYGAAYGQVQPSEPLVLAHARAIARWLVEEEGVALDKIVLVGFSIGGGSAVDVAHGLSKFGRRNMKRSSTRPSIITRTQSAKRMSRDKPPSTIAALVLFAPFSSLRAATRSIAQTLVGHRTSWLISRLLMRTFDNHRLIGAVTAPTFYVHGDDDGIIPLEQSVALATEQFKRQEKKMEKRGTASDKQPPEVYMYVVAGADHDDVGASIGWTASFLESLQTTSASANANALHRFDPVTFMHDPHRYVTPYWP